MFPFNFFFYKKIAKKQHFLFILYIKTTNNKNPKEFFFSPSHFTTIVIQIELRLYYNHEFMLAKLLYFDYATKNRAEICKSLDFKMQQAL